MPRDSSGNYTLPGAYNPVVTGTSIQSAWANTTLTDVAQGVTDSLDRSGRGAMLAALKGFDGSVALPGYGFTNETTTGMSRPSAGNLSFSVLGTLIAAMTATGLSLAQPLTIPLGTVAVPGLTFTGDPNTGIWSPGADIFAVSTAGVERARIGAAGNVTIAAPSSGTALQVTGVAGSQAIVVGSNVGGSGIVSNRIHIGAAGNQYGAVTENGIATATADTWNYAANDFAVQMYSNAGNFSLRTAPSGTAGNPITFTSRLSISNAGNVTIAAPASGNALTITGILSGLAQQWNNNGGTANIGLFLDNSIVTFGPSNATPFALATNGSSRLTIAAAGNVTIAAPTSGAALTVNTVGSGVGFSVIGNAAGVTPGIIGVRDGKAGTREWLMSAGLITAGEWTLYDNTRAATVMTASAAGNVTIAAPSSGNTLQAAQAAGSFIFVGTATVGNFAGLALAGNGQTIGSAFEIFSDTDSTARIRQSANAAMSFATNSLTRVTITNDGRLFGSALHNNAGSVTGTTNQYIASGTYTPTFTNTGNISAFGASVAQWMRVGNVVTVSGTVTVDPITGTLATGFRMSLPIASAFTTFSQCQGCATYLSATAARIAASMSADTTNDEADFSFICDGSVTVGSVSFIFSYVIV